MQRIWLCWGARCPGLPYKHTKLNPHPPTCSQPLPLFGAVVRNAIELAKLNPDTERPLDFYESAIDLGVPPHVAAVVAERTEHVYRLDGARPRRRYMLCYRCGHERLYEFGEDCSECGALGTVREGRLVEPELNEYLEIECEVSLPSATEGKVLHFPDAGGIRPANEREVADAVADLIAEGQDDE